MIPLAFYGFATLLLLSSVAVVFAQNTVHSVLFLILAFLNAAGLFVLLGAEFLAMILVIVYVGAVAVLFLFVVMMLRLSPNVQHPFFSRAHLRSSLVGIRSILAYLVTFCAVFALLVSVPPLLDLAQKDLFQESFQVLHTAFFDSIWLVFKNGIDAYSALVTITAFLLARQAAQILSRSFFLPLISDCVDSLVFMLLLGCALISYFVMLGLGWYSSPYSEEVISSPIPPTGLMTNTQALGQLIYSDYIFAFQTAGIILLIAMIGAIVLSLRHREGIKRQNVHEQMKRKPENTLELKKVAIGEGV